MEMIFCHFLKRKRRKELCQIKTTFDCFWGDFFEKVAKYLIPAALAAKHLYFKIKNANCKAQFAVYVKNARIWNK